jgi:hypothetical protein
VYLARIIYFGTWIYQPRGYYSLLYTTTGARRAIAVTIYRTTCCHDELDDDHDDYDDEIAKL